MSFSDTFLYYPFITIPEKTLVHSLLFQERVRRIIPSSDHMDQRRYQDAQQPNDICRQYLGYNFIEDAEFWEASREVAEMFCAFLQDASTAKRTKKFEYLLGQHYKQRFALNSPTRVLSTQYFVYAQKFDPQVFDSLMNLGWARYDNQRQACELSNELCNIYMALLACCISKKSGRPISTDVSVAESMTRTQMFKKYFGDALPKTSSDEPLRNLCVSLLINGDDVSSGNHLPMEQVLTIHEAARIRAGLELERRSFSDCVSRMIAKAKIYNTISISEFLELEAKEVIDEAEHYRSKARSLASECIDKKRKSLIKNISTGIAITIPLAKIAIEAVGNTTIPGMGNILGTGIEVAAIVTTAVMAGEEPFITQPAPSEPEKVHLFMNRLWDARSQRVETTI
ncbi:hypothetical protein EI77_03593 [Prosthecobacter fusiformis]|uniref:Uncharacterized protein n=1 Tax=Prosthecobacter fusiformis TaxID=48464 RepID=A0A4R7RNV5_9BACT|nr:hypothetical protein [Prosthecobacter fusiformis]TDU66498.1 hypothetical protein EI77_03593 [Prosthecobacter fusiformis]